MSDKKIKKLPAVLQTEANKKFFDATVEQMFSKKKVEVIDGFIGQRAPGTYDPVNDYFVKEPSYYRHHYQMEPVSLSLDGNLQATNEMFYDDFINYLKKNYAIVNNHDRLFAGEYYSFSPPIDQDKFINYFNYYWLKDGLPVIALPGVTDVDIIRDIVGRKNYTYVSSTLTLKFSSGTTVKFPDAIGYNSEYVVEGVGDSIQLVKKQSKVIKYSPIEDLTWDPNEDGFVNNEWDTEPWDQRDADISADYITIERGAHDGNAWSRTNSWYHKDLIVEMSVLTSTDLFAESTRAQRPIIEFFKNIELYKSGTRSLGGVSLASEKSFYEISGVSTVSVDEKVVEANDTMIFLNNAETVSYPDRERYLPEDAPYSYLLKRPVSDEDDVFIIVSRDGYNDFLFGPSLWDNTLKQIFRPEWFSLEDQINTMFFVAHTRGLHWAEKVEFVGDGTTTEYIINSQTYPTNITDLYITDSVDNLYPVAQYSLLVDVHPDYNSSEHQTGPGDFQSKIKVTFVTPIPAGDRLYLTIDDTVRGIKRNDIVDIFINADFTTQSQPGVAGALVYNFPVDPAKNTVFENIYSVVIRNFNGMGADYVYMPGKSDNSVLATPPIVEEDRIRIVLNSSLTHWDIAFVELNLYYAADQVVRVSDYIWKCAKTTDGTNANVLLPVPSFSKPALNGDTVFITQGSEYRGTTFYMQDHVWVESFNQKTNINQAPLFNLYHSNLEMGLPRGLDSFNQSNFAGSEIFSYKRNHNSTINDTVLGFPLAYKNIGQAADIVFENDLETDRYQYVDTEFNILEIPGYYYYKVTTVNEKLNTVKDNFFNSWFPAPYKSKQYLVEQFVPAESTSKFYISATPELTVSGSRDVQVITKKGKLNSSKYVVSSDDKGFYVELNEPVDANTAVDIKVYTHDANTNANAYFEIPAQLKNNPLNEEITEISASELAPHFVSIIENQENFTGTALSGSNNFRDTKKEPGLGTFILQNKNNVLKAMLSSSSTKLDLVESINYGRDEYVRFKDKILYVLEQLTREHFTGDVENQIFLDSLVNEIISRSTATYSAANAFANTFTVPSLTGYYEHEVVDTATVDLVNSNYDQKNNVVLVYSKEVVGSEFVYIQLVNGRDYSVNGSELTISNPSGTFVIREFQDLTDVRVPTTPSATGCLSPSIPGIVYDNSAIEPDYFIVGHDGSRTKVYGEYAQGSISNIGFGLTDLRDIVLLEIEKRIYNNLPQSFISERELTVSVFDVKPGFFRNTRYSVDEWNNIVKSMFAKWVNRNSLNATLHSNVTADWRTWNYRTDIVPGHWKGIYRYYFDTVTPNTTPWEMLGFSSKPSYWDTFYGSDFSSANVSMWLDIEGGVIRGGVRKGVDARFMRPGLRSLYLPVDILGDLRSPHDIGIVAEPADSEKSREWVFGDGAPVEEAYNVSSHGMFDQLVSIFLTEPASFGELLWDTEIIKTAQIQPEQYVDSFTLKRMKNQFLAVHNEHSSSVKHGYQTFIVNHLGAANATIKTEVGDKLRSLTVKLGHKVAGFTDYDSLNLYMSGQSTGSSNQSLLVPKENIQVKLHKSTPIREYVYSGMLIRSVAGGFEVYGYDIVRGAFPVLSRDYNGKKMQLEVAGKPAAFRDFQTDVEYLAGEIVRYNTVFYQCKVSHVATAFNIEMWEKLRKLPQYGSIVATYYPETTGEVVEIQYGTVFTTVQSLVDAIIGYGQWLETEGWEFTQFDADLNEMTNWLQAAKHYMFWTSTSWTPNHTLFLSPAASKAVLSVKRGYPDNVEKTVNGVYSIIDKDGYGVYPLDTVITRDRQTISIEHKQDVGIYAVRVFAVETEHVVIVDNKTVFGDIIFNALLSSRQRRLGIKCKRSADWYGKLEAPGYLVEDNSLTSNFESVADDFRFYYDNEYSFQNQTVSRLAKHHIGFDYTDYLANLGLSEQSQYQFYQGTISQKGTSSPVEKLLRSKYISDSKDLMIADEWAFKLGEIGSIFGDISYEVKVVPEKFKTDPQVIELVYPSGPRGTGSVNQILLLNATHRYKGNPIIEIDAPPGLIGIRATVGYSINKQRFIESVWIESEGEGYESTPLVTFKDSFDNSITEDEAVVSIYNNIQADLTTDEIITIDVDDNSNWVKRPFASLRSLIPTIKYKDIRPVVPTAGYVHYEDVDAVVFSVAHFFEVAKKGTLTLAKLVWVPCLNTDYDWGVFRITDSLTHLTNDLSRKVYDSSFNLVEIIGGVLLNNNEAFTYSVKLDGGAEITTVFNEAGEEVDASIVSDVNTLFFKMLRNRSTVVDPAISWVDNYNGTGWAVVKGGVVHRAEELLADNHLMRTSVIYNIETGIEDASMNVFDPAKGLFPVPVSGNVDYISDYDPAAIGSETALEFADEQVGKLWWDTATCRVLHYEQGTLKYRQNQWGKFVEGSSIDIYEWTKQGVPPQDYKLDGTPRHVDEFVQKYEYDMNLGTYTTKYYYWVKNRTLKPKFRTNRSLSAVSVANLIQNTNALGYQWWAFVAARSENNTYPFIVANVSKQLKDNQNLQLNYRTNYNDDKRHVEWKLVSEYNKKHTVPERIWEKMIDSLVGFTVDNKIVPDIRLTEFERYGIKDYPLQTWFEDIYAARRVFVETINSLVAPILMQDIDTVWKSTLAPSRYLKYSVWYKDDSYKSVQYTAVVQTVADIDVAVYANGDVILVSNATVINGTKEAYQVNGSTLELVMKVDGTFQLTDFVYKDKYKKQLSVDIRNLFNYLQTNILSSNKNQLIVFFALFNYVLSEQDNIDWAFKSTYVSILHEGKKLSQPANYQANPFDSFIAYVNEIKPYQTKVRSYQVSYAAETDLAYGTAYDFDSLMADPSIGIDPFEVPRTISTAIRFDRVQTEVSARDVVTTTGVKFAHSAVEELRLVKNILQNRNQIIITHDLQPNGGIFALSFGAMLRFANKIQSSLSSVHSFVATEDIKYSQYAELLFPASPAELDAVSLFNEQYRAEYKAFFTGTVIDSGNFDEFVLDSLGSSFTESASTAYDAGTFNQFTTSGDYLPEAVPLNATEALAINVDTGQDTFKFIANGIDSTYVLPSHITKEGMVHDVLVNYETIGSNFTVTTNTSTGLIEVTVTSALAVNDVVIIVARNALIKFKYIAKDQRSMNFGAGVNSAGWDVSTFAALDNPSEIITNLINSWGAGRWNDTGTSYYLLPAKLRADDNQLLAHVQNVIFTGAEIVDIGLPVEKIEGVDYEILTLDQFINYEISALQVSNPTLNVSLYRIDRLTSIYNEYADLLVRNGIPLGSVEIGVNYVYGSCSIVRFLNERHNYYVTTSASGEQVMFEYPNVPVSYKIFMPESGSVGFMRGSDTYKTHLTKPLAPADSIIHVHDASVLPNASQTSPGVIWIKGERIEYRSKRGNSLLKVTRRTSGTSLRPVVKDGAIDFTYDVGSAVLNGANIHYVPETVIIDNSLETVWDNGMTTWDAPSETIWDLVGSEKPLFTAKHFWTNNISGLAGSTTPEAEFLLNSTGSIIDS